MLKVRMRGHWYAFKTFSLQRMLAEHKLSPATYEALTAEASGVNMSEQEKAEAHASDLRAFHDLVLTQSSLAVDIDVNGQTVRTRQIVLDEVGESDTAINVNAFTDGERSALVLACSEFNHAIPEDLEVIAPFRHVSDANDTGEGAANDTGGANS